MNNIAKGVKTYKHKYLKYKKKYFALQKYLKRNEIEQIVSYERGEKQMDDDIISKHKEEQILEESEERLMDRIDTQEELDLPLEIDMLDDDLVIRPSTLTRPMILDGSVKDSETPKPKRSEQTDIGMYGLARGREHEKGRYNKKMYVSINKPADKSKILAIRNLDDFDKFTEMYGELGSDDDDTENEYIYIKWNEVAERYKGFYLSSGLSSERYSNAIFKDHTYASWWEAEYKHTNVIIFEEPLYVRYKGRKVIEPFMGRMYAENDHPATSYIRYAEGTDENKILLIDNIDAFDEFTNKYGYVVAGVIEIDWMKVRKDYKGIYIDKDIGIKPARYATAFFKGKRYKSWWGEVGDAVYVFE